MFLTAVRHEVNNLESSVVVHELELAINVALLLIGGFMEFIILKPLPFVINITNK